MIILYSIYPIYKMSQLTQACPCDATRCTSAPSKPTSTNQDPLLTALDMQQTSIRRHGAASPGRAAWCIATGHRWERSRPSGRRSASKTVLLTRGEAIKGSGSAGGSSWAQRALLRGEFPVGRIYAHFWSF